MAKKHGASQWAIWWLPAAFGLLVLSRQPLVSASPVQILDVRPDCISIAWRPVSANVKAWDPQLMNYPGTTSYIEAENEYIRHQVGPNDGETPKLIQAYTYESLMGRTVSGALAFATWGYRISWFEKRPLGWECKGLFLVPALWVKQSRASAAPLYREVRDGRYVLTVPPTGPGLTPKSTYYLVVEALKLTLHQWIEFEESPLCYPSFSPLLPADVVFLPLSIVFPRGPSWYYGLSTLSTCKQLEGMNWSPYPNVTATYADQMPPLSFNTPPADRSRFHYEGPDLPRLGQPWDDPWHNRVYWWYGQPSTAGNGKQGAPWYPVCGVQDYVKGPHVWKSFGAQAPRITCDIQVTTPPLKFEVISTFPSNGERGVKPDVTVEITFSIPIAAHNPAAIRWTDASGQAVEFSTEVNGSLLALKPRKLLSQNSDYRIVIGQNAVSSAEGRLNSDYVFSFSTKPKTGGGGGGAGGLAQ